MKALQRIRVVALIALLGAAIAGCATNPVTGKTELALISESAELSMGAEQYLPTQQSQGGLYTVDPELGEYVQEVGSKLASVSDRALPYDFVVLNNSVPNAWALPGGKIAVNRGLLTELTSEAELAAVLGHEVVHAAARHSANQMQRGMILQGLVLATALSTTDSDYHNYIVGGAQLGAQLLSTRYSRTAELEADLYGMEYMKRAGYNPEAAVSLQETFVRLSEGQQTSWLDGLFASHPPSLDRVTANRETAARLGPEGAINDTRFDRRMAYLRSKQDAYSAFDRALSLANEGEFAPALSSINQAIKLEPREPRFFGLRGDIHLAQQEYSSAEAAFNQALDLDDNYFEYYLGRGLVRSATGRASLARADLERSNQLLPTAVANNKLGELSLAAGQTATAKQYFETAMSAGGQVGEQATNAYVRLDIADNPSRYIEARAVLQDDGVLAIVVSNKTRLDVSDVALNVQLAVNGEYRSKSLRVGRVAAAQQGYLSSGWQFSADDVLTDSLVTVTAARITN